MMQARDIDKRIAELREELAMVTGAKTEVYTRIVGYYRSVRNWNAGKREEYGMRKLFTLPAQEAAPTEAGPAPEEGTGATAGAPAAYLLFTRQTCPACPPVKSFVSTLEMEGTHLDVDTEEGLAAARRYGVMASPTVIFLDHGRNEVFRAHNLGDLRKSLPARA